MYYYTYKINLLKGSLVNKYYLGKHQTENLDDNYAGSGRIIKNYFNKYGKIEGETYTKEIINYYDNAADLDAGEFELIGNLYETDNNCINLRAGGDRIGFSEETKLLLSKNIKKYYINHPEAKQQISDSLKEYFKTHDGPMKGKKHDDETRKKISEGLPDMTGSNNGFYGKKHTEESKKKMSELKKGKKAWNSGIKMNLSEETREIMRNKKLGKKLSAETKKKMSEHWSGKHWRINPETNKREWYS